MKSSTGAHFIALDHVRAVAVFMVIVWHFTHYNNGTPVPFEYVPALFPFSILDEGHSGVALFMTLSGYLFAKLLDGKAINYRAFLWNRLIRLIPLLLVVLALLFAKKIYLHEDLREFGVAVAKGVLFPTMPNGGWSITVEFHFYVILPLLLYLVKKSPFLPLAVLAAAFLARLLIYVNTGEVQSLSYWTLIGRIDQFVLGTVFFQCRRSLGHRHVAALAVATSFMLFYWYLDHLGGFQANAPGSLASALWIVIPTIEGLVYATMIAWYDQSFQPATTGVSKFVGLIGEYSYSIYLLHFFFVFIAARFVHQRIMDISNFYLACLWALLFLFLMMIPGYVSCKLIETPFLRLRKRYIVSVASDRNTLVPSARRY